MATADECKALGNKALQAGKLSEAIENYSSAIRLDGGNHVYYSNRSAAYLKKGDGNNALEDASACIGLNPDFPKGYSRKGAALHALKRYNDSIAAYKQGLEKFPSDAGLKSGLDSVTNEKDGGGRGGMGGGGGSPGAGIFGPQMMAQMAMDPKLRPYLNDPEVMNKIKLCQTNPNLLPTMLQDPKIMQLFSSMMGGAGMGGMGGMDSADAAETASAPAAATPAPTPVPEKKEEPKVEEEDLSGLTPAELKIKENQKAAKGKKEEGNEAYKKKEFEKALGLYDDAIDLDPKNMTFISNKSAVYFTMKKYEECIEDCLKAIEVGKENRAPYEDRAKAYTRAGRAYQKLKDLPKAIEMFNSAQLEAYDKKTQRLLKTIELENRKKVAAEYQDDTLAEEAKQRGNDFFRNQQYGDAVKEYEEAVKRAPKTAPIPNNLAAALCKVMDFSGAKREIEVALDLDPKYVKAWARKGDIEFFMKEFHKSQDSYRKGLEIDGTSKTCREGLMKVNQAVAYGRSSMTEEQKREQAEHGMADPEIQAILQDPIMQQTLRDFKENPASAQAAMANPGMRAKIEKLIAAGIIETG